MYSTMSTECFPRQPRKEKGGFSVISFAQQASYMAASAAAARGFDERKFVAATVKLLSILSVLA